MGQSQQNSIWFGTGYVCLPVMHNTKTSCKLWKMGNVRPFLFCIAILPLNSKDIHATALSGEQALLHTQHAPQQPANKGTQPQSPRPKNKHCFWQLYSSSLWQNSLQTKGAVQYFWWPSVLWAPLWGCTGKKEYSDAAYHRYSPSGLAISSQTRFQSKPGEPEGVPTQWGSCEDHRGAVAVHKAIGSSTMEMDSIWSHSFN